MKYWKYHEEEYSLFWFFFFLFEVYGLILSPLLSVCLPLAII